MARSRKQVKRSGNADLRVTVPTARESRCHCGEIVMTKRVIGNCCSVCDCVGHTAHQPGHYLFRHFPPNCWKCKPYLNPAA